ncbi:hypothetical protein TrVE_jg4998 [Triparma verrucosa]|uniref:Aminotransferase class V domain-containing protein n=1 Tax=Triparma verrucosa TaxID=1606542 RepID=A0A9W7CG93_9STRA|nr:hypothetical protein TrVE_jg4998 [Triparma verrucosa]
MTKATPLAIATLALFTPRVRSLSTSTSFFTAEKIASLREGLPSDHIHFNAAGASPPHASVTERIISHMNLENSIGAYAAESRVAEETSKIYTSLGRLLSCPPSSLHLHDSSTTSFNHGIYSVPLPSPTSRLLSASSSEYASNAISMIKHSKANSCPPPLFIPNTSSGSINLERIHSEILDPKHNIEAIVLTHAPTNGGCVNDAISLGNLISSLPSHVKKPIYLLDACQTVGQVPLSVEDIKCDVLAGTSRKWLRGPRGVGFLYAREGVFDEGFGGDLKGYEWIGDDVRVREREKEREYEYWEGSVCNKLGFGKALDLVLEIGVENVEERVRHLSELTRERITNEVGLRCMDLKGSEVMSGICSFDVCEIGSAKYVVEEMAKRGISVSTSGRMSTLMDAEERDLPDFMVRFSPHYFNQEEEVGSVIDALMSIEKEK